jgi:hypothetical protein
MEVPTQTFYNYEIMRPAELWVLSFLGAQQNIMVEFLEGLDKYYLKLRCMLICYLLYFWEGLKVGMRLEQSYQHGERIVVARGIGYHVPGG